MSTIREPSRRATGQAADEAEEGPTGFWAFLAERRRLFIPMLLGFGSISLSGYTMVSWGPTYIERHFGLTPPQFGPALGVANLCVGLSVILIGRYVDAVFSRGQRDINLRLYANIILAAAPLAGAAFMVKSPIAYFVLYTPILAATAPALVFISSVLAMVAPRSLRGRLVALFLFFYTVVGLGVGPVAVGALTDYVLHDESRIGVSMAIVVVAALVSGSVCLRLARRQFDRLLDARAPV
jgi:MFS family permease